MGLRHWHIIIAVNILKLSCATINILLYIGMAEAKLLPVNEGFCVSNARCAQSPVATETLPVDSVALMFCHVNSVLFFSHS